MDCALFTLFFICLLCPGHVLGKPASDSEAKSRTWPVKCKDETTCNVKPHDYPSEETLRNLYEAQKHNFDFKTQIIKSEYHSGENICRHYDYVLENAYMVLDAKKNIRYAFHIPGLYDFIVQVKPCNPTANSHLDPKYKYEGFKCIQGTSQRPYIVLSQDMKSLETINMTLPTSCLPHKTVRSTVKYY